jgi:UDP-N-acetylmuramate--alanine ligase
MFRGRVRHVHFVGVGGVGMSGLAEILRSLEFEVSGSDMRPGDTTRRLESLGVRVDIGHRAENVCGVDVVVYSSAIDARNPELTEARALGIPVIGRAEMLAELMRVKYGVAIAGSHGKTTTTSLVATVLRAAGLDPTVVVGGKMAALGSNARLGRRGSC